MASIDDVLMDCAPFIELLRQGTPGCYLIRGFHANIDIERINHSLHERTPLNMDVAVHQAINNHFINKFKWPVRNGVF
jgi:hypothetical protein